MKIILHLSLAFGLSLFALNATASTYTVQRGDTIASIARAHYGEPVFGPRGTISKVYKLNPSLKMNATLEPGEKLNLSDESQPPVDTVATAPAVIEPVDAPVVGEAIRAAREQAAKANAAKALQPKIAPVPAAADPQPLNVPPPVSEKHEHVEVHHACEKQEVDDEQPRSYFSITPNYSLIRKTATDVASGTSYSLNSSLAIGAELAWDHWWNKSFSTVVSYSVLQLTSQETSDLSGSKVISNMMLNEAEFSLLNSVAKRLRIGLGLSYADHIFIENFTSAPVDPSIYKIAFLSPFAMVEWTPYESERFEGVVNLKATMLPAQVGQGHDLTSGYEFMGQISLIQKFEKWSLLYGASYSTENQTRTDSNETSSAIGVKVGALL